ncbi:anti-sigma-I factor RsgI family protein [Halobacillus sp. B23F22_1]|uniref:anti-sigma-I factor RsgI family protein n=1 Tax=Halobacillus sp. B23F22_1 TaxID=3459514 RepID=UPI00373F6C74
MRKGIVMEQNEKFTIVMASDGTFHKAKRLKRANIGMEVHFQPFKESSMKNMFLIHRMKFAAVALALLLTLFPAYFWHENNKAYAYVNVDINPSVEMEVNDQMKVLTLNPLNEEAEQLITKLNNWKKKPASEVALQMISLSQIEGYMKSDQEVLIGVSYIKESAVDFSEAIESYLDQEVEDLMLASYNVPKGVRKQAEDKDTSVNELMAESLEEEAENMNKEGSSIEDDDKAIIQSFYEESDSSEIETLPNDSLENNSSDTPFEEELILPDQKPEREQPELQENKGKADPSEGDQPSAQDKMNKASENKTQENKKDKNSKNDLKKDHPSEIKEENGKDKSNGKKEDNTKDNANSERQHKEKPKGKSKKNKENTGPKDKDDEHPSHQNNGQKGSKPDKEDNQKPQ